jgi:aminomethyltransferase
MAHRTPLYAWHVAQKARLVEFGGWDMPIQYTTITEEHQAVRAAAGLFDISHMGRIVFQGAGARDLLQRIFTNDILSMKPGQVRYGLICNESGGIMDDVLIYELDTFWMMVVNASNREKILAWIDQNKADSRLNIIDETLEWGMIALQGPQAHKIVAAKAPNMLNLKYYYASAALTEPGHLRIWSRTGYTGEDGWEIICPSTELPTLVERLTTDIGPSVGVDLKPCGLGARDTLRLEAGMPLYGHELSEQINPFQAGLAWAVKLNKGEFIGKVALENHFEDDSKPIRVGLELRGKRIAREGSKVLNGETEIGQVTSGTFAPTLNKAIAMAYIDPGWSKPGTELTVDVRGKSEPATVVHLPFYKRP